MDYEELCARVFDLEPRIRSVRVINQMGRSACGGMRDGVKSLESPEHNEMMFLELMLRVRMRHEFDAEFGEVEFAMSYRRRVVFFSFTVDDGALVVSCEKSVDCCVIPFEICKIIEGLSE